MISWPSSSSVIRLLRHVRRRLDRRRPTRIPTPSSSLLLEEEGVEVGARVRGLEEVAASPLGHELTLVAVVIGRPRSVVLADQDVEVAVRLVAGRARLQVGSREQLVQLRNVEVREVVVVLGVNRVPVEEDVHEVVRIRVVLVPTSDSGVVRLTLRPHRRVDRATDEVLDT